MELNAIPFKLKKARDGDPVNAKSIPGFHEQNNYTKKYLQTIEEFLLSKPLALTQTPSSTSFPTDPIFKLYEIPVRLSQECRAKLTDLE